MDHVKIKAIDTAQAYLKLKARQRHDKRDRAEQVIALVIAIILFFGFVSMSILIAL